MTTIASMVVNAELMSFANNPDCGLSSMLTWIWPGVTAFNASPSSSLSSSTAQGTNSTSVDLALMAVNSISTLAGATGVTLSATILETVLLYSFSVLFNQIAKFQGTLNIGASDRIAVISTAAVNAASSATVIPCTDPTTGLGSLSTSIACARSAVTAYLTGLSSSDAAIPYVSTLATLVPLVFTPYWTLSYYGSFGDGRLSGATFYDQRYSQMAVAAAFDAWLAVIGQTADSPNMQNVTTRLGAANAAIVSTQENPSSFNTFYTSIQGKSNTALDNIGSLQASNAQFNRRRGSVGALSENLEASRRRTYLALATLWLWIATLVTCLAVAGFLVRQKNFPLVLALVVATITLLTIDALGRGVAGAQASSSS